MMKMKMKTKSARDNKHQHAGAGHTCGECSRGRWDGKHENKDLSGAPFVKVCEFSAYATNANGEHVCLRSTRACERFKV